MVLAFEFLFDRSKGSFERRARFVHGNLSHDSSFEARQTGLPGTLQSDQIEAAVRIRLVAHADGQIKSGLKVVAGIKLFHGDDVSGT